MDSLDYYKIEELLSDEERATRGRARQFVENEVLAEVVPCHRAGKFPDHLIPRMGAMRFYAPYLKDHGCAGVSYTGYGLIMQELERGDSGVRSLASVQGALAIQAIHSFGSPEQHARWLPGLVSGERVGCFALTEHGHGSDPGGMETYAKRDGDSYILNGSKCWIGNASIADVKVVWAKDDDGRVGGFVVEKDAPGFRGRDIEGKFSLRMSRTSECWFENCRIPAENRLPNAAGLRAPLSCLSYARVGIAWGVIGAATDCYETALAYAKTREQFGRPIGSFQLVQQKLVWMAQEITKAQLLALRLTRLMEAGKSRPAQISMAKRNNVWMALQCARKARDILGAAGITDQYPVIRHVMNLESVYTYEGTHDIHTLAIGRDITGLDAFGG
ncbi:MAG TPA: acyl-CoA dehydrogenase family protein [Candidatus Udaeobacter sp.]|nr:acyl-CoA dehydrogenase family protein [Candidatus Udaeobacter sp.]